MNYAIDKKAYQKVVFNGYAKDMTSVIGEAVRYYSPNTPYPYDLAKAMKLMTEAGYPNGLNLEIWGLHNTEEVNTLQFLQQQLSLVGVKATVKPLEDGVMDGMKWGVKADDSKMKMLISGWSPSTNDADWGIRPIAGGMSWASNGVCCNYSFLEDPKVDKLIAAGTETADPKERAAIYKEMQDVLWQDAVPFIFLAQKYNIWAHRDNLKEAYRIDDGTWTVERAYFGD